VPASRLVQPLLAAATVAAAVAAILLTVPPEAVRAAPEEPPADPVGAGIAVAGVGTATGTPDVLRLSVAAEVSADTVDAALTSADEAARAVLDALADAGVADEDVQTVDVSVYPRYDGEGQQVTGYTARHGLQVTLRDVSGAGAVIGAVVEAGGDAARVEGIGYALEDDAAVQERAREAAFADARRKAEQYAALVGRELGDVVSVRENVTPSVPTPYAAADEAGAGRAVELAPGSTSVTVTAEVHWSLR
jgi:uncharacterized protein YggE